MHTITINGNNAVTIVIWIESKRRRKKNMKKKNKREKRYENQQSIKSGGLLSRIECYR